MDELKNETTAPGQESQGAAGEPKKLNPMVAMLLTPKIIGIAVGVLVVLWLMSSLFGGKSKSVDVSSSRGLDMQTSYNYDKQPPLTTSKKDEPPIVTVYPKAAQTETQTPKPATSPIMTYPASPQRQPEANTDLMKKTVASVLGQSQGGRVKGVAFLTACIEPLDYELNKRWWGWRPNDPIQPTDNVNNFQLGVLEVTRRTSIHLAQRISRTGSTVVIDPDLEQAMNRLMVKASQWVLPTAESQYKDAIERFRIFIKRLEKGEATIYTRAENLEPLLVSYDDLLGSCDENLVKTAEEDGKAVSWFKIDDYFYYSQGIASAMKVMLIAIREDFSDVLNKMQAMEAMDHAIEWSTKASEIHPLIVLDGSPGSIFANHRANMAAPISHARFYVEVVIKAITAGRTG